jgi:hypothetical protein
MKTAKNAIGVTRLDPRASYRPPGSLFADTAIGSAPLTPEQRRIRKAWLANSHAREAQLLEIAGAGMIGTFEPGAVDQVSVALNSDKELG